MNNNRVTIDEVKELRLKLGADLTEMVARFQKQSGCVVRRIDIEHLFTDADHKPVRTVITAEVEIP
jgi:hypothetical protein